MNTPNKLTLLRILLVPVFLVFLLVPSIPYRYLIAAALFAIASVTDLIDGHLARKYNQVTNFGKFLDPLADKLLVISALVAFVQLGLCPAWIPIVVIARELLVTSLRLVASGSGVVIAANFWGKAKTNSQIFAVIAVMLCASFGWPALIGTVLLWICVLFTVVSGLQYLWAYRNYIDSTK